MRSSLLVPEILELLDEGRDEDLVQVISDLHPHDAATILSGMEPERIVDVMHRLPVELERDVFAYLDPDVQEAIVIGSGRQRVKDLLAALPSDDRFGFIDRLDPRIRETMLPLLTRAGREDLLRRQRFEEDQVGALLSTEYSQLRPQVSVKEAIEEIRRQEPRRETIYYSYVTDEEGHLLGFVSLRKLITSPPHRLVRDVMVTDVIKVEGTADREDVARMIREYDLLAIPVVDHDNRLLGIVTHDDAADIAEEEAEEDIEMLAGISAAEERPESYLEAPIATAFRRRIPVLAVLTVSYLVTGSIIGGFEHVLEGGPKVFIMLLPMILATGGNVGNQTSVQVILALRRDLQPHALLRVLWKEWRVGLLLAAVLSVLAGGEAFFLLDQPALGPLRIAGTVALALTCHVMSAATLGVLIPLTVAALGKDPSMVANPALASIADLSGALIYFTTISALAPLV